MKAREEAAGSLEDVGRRGRRRESIFGGGERGGEEPERRTEAVHRDQVGRRRKKLWCGVSEIPWVKWTCRSEEMPRR